jgi:DNA polymerase-3 subunit beta
MLSATDLELSLTCWAGAKIDAPGEITVPASTFADLVGTLPPDQVTLGLEEKSQTLTLKCGSTEAEIKGISAGEFPLLPEWPEARLHLPAEDFREIVSQVTFAAATENSRPVLTAVLVKFEPGALTMATADGYRVAERVLELETGVQEPVTLLVPAKGLIEAARAIKDAEGDVAIALPEARNQVMFSAGDVEVVAQLVDGNFPAYEQVIPLNLPTVAVMDRLAFLHACRRAEVFARESANTLHLAIEPGESDLAPGTVTLRATSQETGQNASVVTASITGPKADVAFNVKFLIEWLRIAGTEQVSLSVRGESTAGVFKPVGMDGYTYVVMPMHIHR